MHAGAGMEVASSRDRLSNLPDCLLHDILSQLRSRQAVQTCVLSPRWRHLWRAVPCIRIDSKDFPIQDAEEEALAKLEDFADGIMFHRCPSAASSSESALDALRVRVRGGGSRGGANLGRWIRRGLKLSPAALDVSRRDGKPIKLPPFPSSTACRLTSLRLDGVLLHRDFEHLLASGGLPVLEDLEIRNAARSGIKRIACDTLRRLTVDLGVCPRVHQDSSHRITVVVDSRLASLQLEFPLVFLANFGFDIGYAKKTRRRRLAHASIRLTPFDLEDTGQLWLGDDEKDDSDEDADEYNGYEDYYRGEYYGYDYDEELDTHPLVAGLHRLLRSLSRVTSLHLSGFQEMYQYESVDYVTPRGEVQCCDLAEIRPPPRPVLLLALQDKGATMFPNLTSLVLEDCHFGANLRPLWCFVRMAPALNRLALDSCECEEYDYCCSKRELEQDTNTATTVPNLKLVRILYGDDELHAMVKQKLPSTTITITE